MSQTDPIRTVGVEEEFLLVESGTPFLASVGEEVVATAGTLQEGQFEHELKQEQAETGTAPHRHIAALERELRARRAALTKAAEVHSVRLLASGTSPLDQASTTTVDRRYGRMEKVFGRLTAVQLTCGMHVHVSVESRAEGVAVLDRIRGWLPVLTALSANSPFLAGDDTEHASYRSLVWGQWPTAGATDPFGSVEAYDGLLHDLIATGAALDDAMIYFDARLSARYPTVEIRVADVCADVRDAPVLAALARALVSTAAAQARDGVEPPPLRSEIMRAARWHAARWGVEEQLVDPRDVSVVPAGDLLDRLLELVGPELDRTGDAELVRDGLARIHQQGSGARLQRAAYAEGGIPAVVDAVARATAID